MSIIVEPPYVQVRSNSLLCLSFCSPVLITLFPTNHMRNKCCIRRQESKAALPPKKLLKNINWFHRGHPLLDVFPAKCYTPDVRAQAKHETHCDFYILFCTVTEIKIIFQWNMYSCFLQVSQKVLKAFCSCLVRAHLLPPVHTAHFRHERNSHLCSEIQHPCAHECKYKPRAPTAFTGAARYPQG